MKKVVVLTGSETRHTFLRRFVGLSDGIEVLASYCEGSEKSLRALTEAAPEEDLQRKHLDAREQTEEDFFGLFIESVTDRSRPVFLPKGRINADEFVQAIIDQRPDLLVGYGCSIIRGRLLDAYAGRFLNVHLGLSPYYRGSGTNFWPLVNGEPEYVGATFMHIDAGIDTGAVIHQIRPRIVWNDTPSTIGNRLIAEMARTYCQVINKFDELAELPPLPVPADAHFYRRRDYTTKAVEKLYANFRGNLIEDYLRRHQEACAAVPILVNPALRRTT